MNSREKINSIKSVINEFYHDMNCKGNLTECANECWKEYQQFCEDIKKDLERLESLEAKFDAYYELHKQLEKGYDELSVDNEKLIQENRNLKKVIEILCANNIHIRTLKLSKNVDEYNSQIENYSYYDELTQEEYKLLKEWFGNEN